MRRRACNNDAASKRSPKKDRGSQEAGTDIGADRSAVRPRRLLCLSGSGRAFRVVSMNASGSPAIVWRPKAGASIGRDAGCVVPPQLRSGGRTAPVRTSRRRPLTNW